MNLYRGLCVSAISLGALSAGVALVRAADTNSKPTIKEIMKDTHKGDNSMVKQILAGKGTQQEVDTLLADYKIMADLQPPRGTPESWKEKTSKLIAATSALKLDDPATIAAYKSAVECKACHSVHKPPKKP